MRRFIILTCVFVLLFVLSHGVLAKTCCWRNVVVDINGDGNGEGTAETVFNSVLTSREYGGGPELKCPSIDIKVSKHTLEETGKIDRVPDYLTRSDYSFEGVLSRSTDIEEYPPVHSYSLNVNLVDIFHGKTVKGAAKSWYCIEREAGECARLLQDNVTSLARSFHPLDRLIYDYEQIPESVEIEPEDEPVLAGDQIKIKLRVKDIKGRAPKQWQRILVKADRGKIQNGKTYDGLYYEFEAGGGMVEVKYRAPEPCRNDTDTIEVYNSCTTDPELKATPEQKIGEKKLDIFCVDGSIRISFKDEPISSMFMTAAPFCNYKKHLRKNEGVITFRIKPTDDPCYYRVEQYRATPVSYNLSYTSFNKEECPDIKIVKNMRWSLRSSALGTFIDFGRNSKRPFYVDFDTSVKCLYVYGPLRSDCSEEHKPHNNMWPLNDGYSDDINIYQIRLSIDQKGAEGLQNRCRGK